MCVRVWGETVASDEDDQRRSNGSRTTCGVVGETGDRDVTSGTPSKYRKVPLHPRVSLILNTNINKTPLIKRPLSIVLFSVPTPPNSLSL